MTACAAKPCPRHLLDAAAPACGDLGAGQIANLVDSARSVAALPLHPDNVTAWRARGLLALAAQLAAAEDRERRLRESLGRGATGYGYEGAGEP